MPDSFLIDRLAALPALASVPRAQLEWLAARGEVRRFDGGTVVFSRDRPPPGLYIVLSGRLSFRAQRAGISRILNELNPGAISGRLPYSRMSDAAGKLSPGAMPGVSFADEPVEILLIAGADVREMIRECYDFTALCVHEMVDRTRLFKSDDLQREKMASLGRLSAGLAHELNNPSSAVARSAKEMDACRLEVVAASRELGTARLTGPELAAVAALEAAAERISAEPHSPLVEADREDRLAQWLDDHGLALDCAEPLARTAVTTADLDAAAAALAPQPLAIVLRWVAANAAARRLTAEIESAATRIHSLVAAVKKHTHMDRAPVAEAVALEGSLRDTVTLVGSKARAKGIALELHVEPDLPPVQAVPGELNQVWLNLVDNAIDAAPAGGHVSVTAASGRNAVTVTVADDGAGVTEADRDRIFEPFFTTKAVGQGTGLGLDVVQAIVRSYGGSIELHSGPGCTEFQVSLPVFSPASEAAS